MKHFYHYFTEETWFPPSSFGKPRVFFLSLLLVATVGLSAFANQEVSAGIELNLKDVTLKEALREIERQTSYNFVVNLEHIFMIQ